MLWFQGEADADSHTPFKFLSDSYEVNLPHLVHSIRNDLKLAELPFSLGKIKCGSTIATWDNRVNPLEVVRHAEQKTADTGHKVLVFDTMDLQFKEDHCHFDTHSMMTVGYRFAKSFQHQQSVSSDEIVALE